MKGVFVSQWRQDFSPPLNHVLFLNMNVIYHVIQCDSLIYQSELYVQECGWESSMKKYKESQRSNGPDPSNYSIPNTILESI
jgi:peptide methionine sulfoxide reductase MsrB